MEKITKENFITDDKTNMFYISSLFATPGGGLESKAAGDLLSELMKFPYEKNNYDDNQLKREFNKSHVLLGTKDVWARDYMPIQLTDDIFLSFIYKPDYLKDLSQYVTNWQTHQVHTELQKRKAREVSETDSLEGRVPYWDFKVVNMPLVLDGGNVVKAITKAGNPCFIMCDKVLKENHLTRDEFDSWWKSWWEYNFDNTKMEYVLIPWEGKSLNPIGHADGMVRFIGKNTVLMTNYPDFDKAYNNDPKYKTISHDGENMEKALQEAGFDVRILNYDKEFGDQCWFKDVLGDSWCYINYLQLGHRVLVPSLKCEELNQSAYRQISEAFKSIDENYSVAMVKTDMTSIVKYDDGKSHKHPLNGGGALNCLTWTIKG